MFTLSCRGIYGMLAMVELAENYHKGPIHIKNIAAAQNIPQHYLEQLLIVLKKDGFVKSFRGSRGGYSLAQRPDKIRIIDLLQSLEGQLVIVSPEKTDNALAFFWESLKNRIKNELNLSFSDLLLSKKKQDNQFSYVI